jgi:hypothetical protein
MTISARYENGVFKPLDPVEIKEGTVVEVHVPTDVQPSARGRPLTPAPDDLLAGSVSGPLRARNTR